MDSYPCYRCTEHLKEITRLNQRIEELDYTVKLIVGNAPLHVIDAVVQDRINGFNRRINRMINLIEMHEVNYEETR